MARILFAWELGSDYGHLARLLPVARELGARGHETLFAIRDLLGAEALLAPHGLRWFQAPLWTGQVTNLPPAISYAEMLMRFGFLSSRALLGICHAWRNLVDVLQPDLLVLDHAPTALLASRGLGMPRLNLGDGFCIPPPDIPIPPFRWWQQANQARLHDSEKRVWQTAAEVAAQLGAPPLASLGELAACDEQLLCTFAELDHYPQRTGGSYLGPIFALGQGAAAAWPRATGPRIFAYLKPGYAELERVLQALGASDASVLVHVPGIARQTIHRHSSARMVFAENPVDMEAARRGCDLAVCHGGAGTTAAMLLAGRPLLLLPMQMEQAMAAHRLAQTGAAVEVPVEATGQLPAVLRRVLGEPRQRQAAERFAATHADYDQATAVRQAADRCTAWLPRNR